MKEVGDYERKDTEQFSSSVERLCFITLKNVRIITSLQSRNWKINVQSTALKLYPNSNNNNIHTESADKNNNNNNKDAGD